MTKEQRMEIEEKADNYMRGRAMAVSFKPLSLEDIKEAVMYGAEEMEHLIEEE
jgi:hypothetical protein